MGINVAGVLFAIGPDGGVAALPEIFGDLADTSGARLATLSFVGPEDAWRGLAGKL